MLKPRKYIIKRKPQFAVASFISFIRERKEIMCGPLIDWNGNGRIDPSDIAISLAISEEEDGDDDETEEEDVPLKH